MLFMNNFYAILIFMIIKFVQSTVCRNGSKYQTLSDLNKSLIICQTFTKEDASENKGKSIYIQKRVLHVPNKFNIFLSVKVDMDPKEWNVLPINRRRIVWSKSRSQLYWSCDNIVHSLSLCNSSNMLATTSLIIDFYDGLKSIHYLQCSICFLTELNDEYVIHFTNASPHIGRIVFDLHQYLPQHLSNDEDSAIKLQITRLDRIPVTNEIGKVFTTNISMTHIINDNDNPSPNVNCKFYCGWGPKCLLQVRDVCNKKMNCVNGEDEDSRLCKAIDNATVSITNDIHTTLSKVDNNQTDSIVISTLKSYLFVIICAIILLVLFIFVGWFTCRNCGAETRFVVGSVKQLNSTILTPDSDTSCSTCEMKSKLNSAEFSRRSRRPLSTQQSQLSDRRDSIDPELLRKHRNEAHFIALSSNSQKIADKDSLKHLHRNEHYYSNRDHRVIQSSEWLNLFFHVSSEARHKSLLKKPPPNVNNNNSEIAINKSHKFSTTPFTCVFLVMI